MKKIVFTIALALCLTAQAQFTGVPSKIAGTGGSKVSINLDGSITILTASGQPIGVYGSDTRFDSGPIDLGAISAPPVSGASDVRLYWDGANLKISKNGGAFTTWNTSGGGLSSTDIDTTTEINALTTNDDFPTLAATNVFTALQSITRSNAQAQTNTVTGLGATTVPGIQLTNTTAAAAGAQQYSPSVRWTGQGWKTNATAASQSVEFRAYVVPVQGTANPSGTFMVDSSVDGGAWVNRFSLNTNGTLNIANFSFGASSANDFKLINSGTINFSSTSAISGGTDLTLSRGTAGVLAFGSSVTGQTFRSIPNSPAQITADQNNYNPAGSSYYQRWSTDASRNITGMTFTAAPVDGQTHVIANVGNNNIVLVHESASSTAANRFHNSTGADITIAADQEVNCWYDSTTTRWRVTKRGF